MHIYRTVTYLSTQQNLCIQDVRFWPPGSSSAPGNYLPAPLNLANQAAAMSPWYWKSIRSILSGPDSHRRFWLQLSCTPKKPFPWTMTPKKNAGERWSNERHGWFAPRAGYAPGGARAWCLREHQETKGFSEQAYGGGKGRSETWWNMEVTRTQVALFKLKFNCWFGALAFWKSAVS